VNDPWAVDPPKITAHQVSQIVTLIEDYTSVQAADLISELVRRHGIPGQCGACKQVGRHSDTCVTQGRD
jgi:hypothetical protein